jgi:hypothetical protein
MAEYRCGGYAAADVALKTAIETAATTGAWRSYAENTSSFFLSMSLFKEGREAEARELFAITESKMKPLPADEKNPLADGKADHSDLNLWLAYKEARALLNAPAPASPKTQP